MAQIPSWLWLISGIAIIFFSKYMGGKVEMFFWVGLVFAIIGLAKILVGFIMREGKPKKDERSIGAPFYPAADATAPAHASVTRFCPRCGTQVHPSSYFCHKCGLRLR